MDKKKVIEDLERNGEYKVLRKYEKPNYYHHDDGSEKFKGLYLDVETTGLDASDKIIEIALVPFDFSKDGRIFKIHDSYSFREDPKVPLTQKIINLTGLTDEMLAGKSFDVDAINKVVESALLIVAHNAAFDRKMVERRFPVFIEKAWGCSQTQIPWKEENFSSSALDYLAYKFGYFYEPHRAENDCLAGIRLLSMKLPNSKNLVLDVLIKNADKKVWRVWAKDMAFSKKDILKNRGYNYYGEQKTWYIEIDKANIESELEYLEKEIYDGEKKDLPISTITAFNRFSERTEGYS